MSWNMKPKAKSDFEYPEIGSQPARLVAIIDLGTHERSYQGKVTGEEQRIFFVWELVRQKKQNGEPFFLGVDHAASLGRKANLRKMVEGWIGKELKDDVDFDLTTLLGKPCALVLTRPEGKDYVKVSSVTRLDKEIKPGNATQKPFVWKLGNEPKLVSQDWLPYVFGVPLADKIGQCKERKGNAPPVSDNGSAAGNDDDDEINF